MPVFALYNFNENGTVLDDAPINGIQNGIYLNGASASGGDLLLDGVNDFVKIYGSPEFQMPRGTLEINFTPTGTLTEPQTVLSRDSAGENQGSYRVEVNPDGSILVSHETETGTTTFTTGPGFYSPGDTINLSYSWDQGGTGGVLDIENTTTGADYRADVPPSLTMDMADQSQPWFVGTGQANSDPEILNNIDGYFQGSVEFFSLSDTVDNLQDPDANPDTATTPEDTPVVIDVLDNDTDPNGQPLEIVGVPTTPNGTVTVNPDGTIRYVPNTNFNGTDTIVYTVTDPDGNTSTSTVTVTVTPVNDAPEANPDTSVTAFNAPVTFAVLGNDTDVDGDTLAISGTPTSADGTVTVNADGTLTFTPNDGFTGVATVNYTIVDEEGLTDATTWTITVGTAPARDGIVSGTTGDDLIDASYVDPTDGDRVDANDALLPGEVGNDDIIRAGDGNDTILAGNGNDEVEAGSGNDSVNGNDGDDSIEGQAGNDSIFGDAGNDTIEGGDGNDGIVGGDGVDSVDGGAGDDTLQGNAGNDVVTGGAGNDSMLGGDGDDTLTSGITGSPDRTYPGLYTADLAPNDDRDEVLGGFGNDIIFTGDDADSIFGGRDNDTIDAGNDDDSVSGGENNDVVQAGEGNDTVRGDDGDDLIYGGTTTNTGPTDLIDADDLDDSNNRDLLTGGLGNDSIYGGDDADTIDGGEGADLLDGGIDDDSITGDVGNDALIGGEGDDSLYGGTGDDTIRGDGPGVVDSNDRAYPGLYPADSLPGNNRDLILAGEGNDQVFGGDDADTIFGDAGADTLYAGIDADQVLGEAGNDTLVGEEGSDTLDGGIGNDLIVGGNYDPAAADPLAQPTPLNLTDASDLDPGNDRDSLIGNLGDDTIYGLDDDDTLEGGDGNDLLYGGIDEDSLSGGAGNDRLFGEAGDDTVDGGAGNDLITDGAGNDSAVGGADRDTFVGGNAGDDVDGSETGDDFDTLDLRGVGPISITYDPLNAENGTVTYLDGAGNPTGTLDFVNIENVLSDVPDANPDTATTPEDQPVTIDVLGNDTDPNGQPLTVVGTPTAPNGTVTVNPDGTLEYTPDPDFNGTDTITYTVTDPDGNQATSTVTVTVTPVNDAPVANDDASVTPFNTPVTFAVLGNDTDVDGDTLTITGTPTSPNGTVVVNADGTLRFTPTPGFTGLATVNYTIVDEEGLTDTAVWTITVEENPDRDGIVSGTTGDDLINIGYVDPTDGDRVDANDALLPGEVGNDDIIRAGDGNDTVIASLGNDEVEAGDGNDLVNGNAGNDSLEGEAGNDTLRGDEGNDTLDGGLGDDSLAGGDNDDLITGGTGNDTVDGGTGNDTITSGAPGTPDRTFPGLYTADPTPNDDRDSVVAGDGDDVVRTGDDADTVFGGAGNDRLESGVDDDTVDGGAGNDTVIAGEGNDTVGGGTGDDLMFGGDGPGTDPTEVPDATDPDPENNRDSLSGGIGNDTLYGQDDDDTLSGGSGNDLIFGGIDEDSIIGGSGDDDLRGGEGADTINGGDGSDTVFGQQDNDVIDTSGGDNPLPDVDYPGIYGADTDPENDRDSVSGGLGDDTITTGDDADTITGDDGNDVIDAGVDDDLVDAGRGNDTVLGSEGDDTIDGGLGNDLIYGGLAGTLDLVELPDAVDLRPDNNRDSLLGGDGNDTIFGRDDDDTIDGGAGNDLIDGGIDEDSVLGGTGNDTVTGSQGADTAAGGDDRDVFLIGSQGAGVGDNIDGNEGGDDFDTLDLRGSGPLSIVYDPANAENGVVTFLDADGNPAGTLNFVNIENVIPCFTPGTLIATPKGEVPVESLKPGDKVVTRDNGIQEIRWTGQKAMSGQDLRLNSHLQPIFVKRGSLGNGLPEQDMMVSPNHRLLVANDRTQLYFDEHEVLVAAKHLVGTAGVHAVEAIGVTYIHFMFDRHEVVLSNGAWTESFQPGDYTLKGMGNSQRNEIFDLFPELKTQEGLEDYQAARRTLKRHEARLLLK